VGAAGDAAVTNYIYFIADSIDNFGAVPDPKLRQSIEMPEFVKKFRYGKLDSAI
jgi:hypothetical protein